MKPTQIKKLLISAFKGGKNVLVLGSPGIGKSEIIQSICNEIEYELATEIACTADPVDYKGLPAVINKENYQTAEFIPYGILNRMINATKPLVVFFDDLGWAPPSVINAVCHIIQAREINGKKISDFVNFVAASNRREDSSNVAGLSKALVSRFACIINFEIDVDQWINWAIKKNVYNVLLAFIKSFPEKINDFDPKNKAIENFACPRTIYNLSFWLDEGFNDFETISGTVGPKFTTDFIAYFKISEIATKIVPQVLSDPEKAELVTNNSSTLYALLMILVNKMKVIDKANGRPVWNTKKIFTYLNRCPREFAAWCVKSATIKYPEIIETEQYVQWAIDNQDLIN